MMTLTCHCCPITWLFLACHHLASSSLAIQGTKSYVPWLALLVQLLYVLLLWLQARGFDWPVTALLVTAAYGKGPCSLNT